MSLVTGFSRIVSAPPVAPGDAPKAVSSVPAPLPLSDDALRFRDAMSFLASGVVVVTSSLGGRPWGMTVSSACPVSVDPPTMLVSLATRTALATAVAESGRFGVNVLGDSALGVARFASAVGQPKFLDDGLGIDCGQAHPSSLMLEGALSHVDCKVTKTIEHETHTLFIGEVQLTNVAQQGKPLVHFHRNFWQLAAGA